MNQRPRTVLVVDDQVANLRLFEARLNANGYDTRLASSAAEALALLAETADTALPDLLMLDVMMPEMDGFELLSRLKASPRCRTIPVLMVTALNEPADRARALALGADDFLSKPVNPPELLARVRNLTELGALQRAEGRRGEPAGGVVYLLRTLEGKTESETKTETGAERLLRQAGYEVRLFGADDDLLEALAQRVPDIALLDTPAEQGVALCTRLKVQPRVAHVPVVLVIEAALLQTRARGWDADVDDYLAKPLDESELLARVRSLVRRKRKQDELFESYDALLQRSITDPLTGARNRAYLDEVLRREVAISERSATPFAFVMLDIDRFKRINDHYGHPVGDRVLQVFATLLRDALRTSDVVARYGGEEFAVILHAAPPESAPLVAERLRECVKRHDWAVLGLSEAVTVSIGLAFYRGEGGAEALVKRADEALYEAKNSGRDRVVTR